MDFELLVGIFPQVLLDGLLLGFMYALIALGYTMVYGVLEFINFAHSEIFIVGAFVGVEILLSLKNAGALETLPWPLVLLGVMLAGMLASGALAVSIERIAYRPLRAAPRDRKSTRLNSSHVAISYAVFCLKKKKKEEAHLKEPAGSIGVRHQEQQLRSCYV